MEELARDCTVQLNAKDVEEAVARIAGVVRPVTMIASAGWPQLYAAEFLQYTGTFKARGAANFLAAHIADGTVSPAGVAIASGGNAGLALAWAARLYDLPATIFVPTTAPLVKVALLRAYGADVRLVGAQYADAAEAAARFVARTGALASHAYDNLLVAAGAGTLMSEILTATRAGIETVVVSVGGGGLLAGIATVAGAHDVRVVAVEPEHCRAFATGREAGEPVDVTVDSVAADSLGARRVTQMALDAARVADVRSVLVTDDAIIAARQYLWREHRLAVEHAAAATLAALHSGAYQPEPNERIVSILCGANTDLNDLATRP